MTSLLVPEIPSSGFSFDLCQRNNSLIAKGFADPKAVKTGTTIVGVVYKDGVILGGDTRATEDTIVADKYSLKIHYLAPNMYCCGAGTAADTEMTTEMISSKLELHRLNTGRIVPVCTANMLIKQMLFRYQGHVGAALILGGYDLDGPQLYCIYPHGSTEKLKYTTMGSGSLAAMAVFESRWKPDMLEEEAKLLVADGIRAGVFNDLASGSNVDLCVIRKNNVEYIRPYDTASVKGERQISYRYKPGTTAVLSKTVQPIIVENETVSRIESEPMDTSS
ncbi:hypothetical protein HN011_006318 [Eciton burchellii]|nr:hypothetical protein HN011_006318 [Eciton burchellii]